MRTCDHLRYFGSRNISSVLLLSALMGVGAARLTAQTARSVAPPPAAVPPKPNATDTSAGGAVFLAKPYVQLGSGLGNRFGRQSLSIVWQTPDEEATWALELKPDASKEWVKANAQPAMRRIAVAGVAPHRVYSCSAGQRGLNAGYPFGYRVLRNEQPVFESQCRAKMPGDAPFRVVAFGDSGADTPAQRQIAYQTYQLKPDMVLLTGNLASPGGRIADYRQKFFPIYNADNANPAVGVPLMRSTLFVAVPGSDDIARPDLAQAPDGLAYYYYWSQPLNGPVEKAATGKSATLAGPDAAQKAFLDAAKGNYPRMANFSFDYGNIHWTVLDSSPYVDWTNAELRDWVTQDLAEAQQATWRFVAFHHADFSSSKDHASEQQMRLLSDIFEQNHVDVVFSGHVNNYQRAYPLTFAVKKNAQGTLAGAQAKNGAVAGEWTLDKTFDGVSSTRPRGVLYLTTGAGGAPLSSPEQQSKPALWQPFTFKYIADTYSLTTIDVNGKTLLFRQISAQGKELDHFTVTK